MGDPENVLAAALNDIDQPQQRIANLTNLVRTLSPWERRHLRLQLGDRNGLAGFDDLPVDVVCNLIRYLKIEDVLACAAASKRCRATWTEPSVAACLCLHFFPTLQPPFTFSAFCDAGKKYFVRRAGRFATRLSMSLPFGPSDNMLTTLLNSSLETWDRDSRTALRPDPALHPGDQYPAGWLEMLVAKFACYGGGNVVWFALPDFFVVDNMYSRTRRVIRVRGGMTMGWTASSSKALVVLLDNAKNRLLIYDIETNTSSYYHLPSGLRSMIIRDRRIFLVLYRMQVCILDHDGSRVLTKYHFGADEALKNKLRNFSKESGTVLIFPHPHDLDCFFVAIRGWLGRDPLSEDEDVSDCGSADYAKRLIVAEFKGSLHIATYQDPWETFSRADDKIDFADEAEALDDMGTYATGHWRLEGRDRRAVEIAGAPPLPKGFARYDIQTCFNTITREFGIQRHLIPSGARDHKCGAPWNLQNFIPYVPEPGLLKIRRFDAADADSYPTRSSRPETNGERVDFSRDWTIRSPVVDEFAEQSCRFYHDEDFTVMLLEELHLVYVWSYVDDEEAWGAVRPSSALQELREAMELD